MRRSSLESRVFGSFLLITTGLFLWMVRAFLTPVFGAAVLTILFWPVYQKVTRISRGRRSLAALLTTVLVVVAFIVPSALLAVAVTRQGLALYRKVAQGGLDLGAPLGLLERHLPMMDDVLGRYGVQIETIRAGAESAALSATQYVASHALNFGQDALRVSIFFVLTLYLLFFFLRDGERILTALLRAVPMGGERERQLFTKFAEVSRATVKGTLVVSAVQGMLGGALFAAVGIQASAFWGVAMGVLTLLPAVGPALIWGPAAVLLIATGSLAKGVVVLFGGALVVSLVDNILRPILIGRSAQMPDYLVLLATLGGIGMFGLAGFVAGPVLAALFLVMWQMLTDSHTPGSKSEAPQAVSAGLEPAAEVLVQPT